MPRVFIKVLPLLFLCLACSASAAVVIVEWDANSETNVAGYKVYWGSVSRSYESVADVANATAFTNDFSLGLHFLAVTACDTDGLESDFSEELAVELIPPPLLRFESNTLSWTGTGSWQVCWTTALSTNRQIVFTNRVSLGLFPAGAMIFVRRCELGATNVLSDFSAPRFFDPPTTVRAIRIRVLLQKSRRVDEPFTDFAEAPFFDEVRDQGIYRARLEITQEGLRLR